METIHGLSFVTVMILALAWDVKERRIPNWLTGSGLLIGILLGALRVGGIPTEALLGAGIGLVVTLPLFLLGGIGGGDAKLIAVAGAFLGTSQLLAALVATAMIGGGMALLAAFRSGMLLPLFVRSKDLAVYLITLGRFGSRPSPTGAVELLTIPYGVAIALGGVIVWVRPLLEGWNP